MSRTYKYTPAYIHENSLKQPIHSTAEYVANKTAKTYNYVYSFPDDVYYHAITGVSFTPTELDSLHPTNKDLKERRTI